MIITESKFCSEALEQVLSVTLLSYIELNWNKTVTQHLLMTWMA